MKQFFLLSLVIILAAGCKKKKIDMDKLPFNGTYQGTLHSIFENKHFVYGTQAKFSGNTYNGHNTMAKTGMNEYNLAWSKGTFGASSATTVNFSLDPSLMYTADFDWGTIMKGEYVYSIKGDSLFLFRQAKVNGQLSYEYRLRRIGD